MNARQLQQYKKDVEHAIELMRQDRIRLERELAQAHRFADGLFQSLEPATVARIVHDFAPYNNHRDWHELFARVAVLLRDMWGRADVMAFWVALFDTTEPLAWQAARELRDYCHENGIG